MGAGRKFFRSKTVVFIIAAALFYAGPAAFFPDSRAGGDGRTAKTLAAQTLRAGEKGINGKTVALYRQLLSLGDDGAYGTDDKEQPGSVAARAAAMPRSLFRGFPGRLMEDPLAVSAHPARRVLHQHAAAQGNTPFGYFMLQFLGKTRHPVHNTGNRRKSATRAAFGLGCQFDSALATLAAFQVFSVSVNGRRRQHGDHNRADHDFFHEAPLAKSTASDGAGRARSNKERRQYLSPPFVVSAVLFCRPAGKKNLLPAFHQNTHAPSTLKGLYTHGVGGGKG